MAKSRTAPPYGYPAGRRKRIDVSTPERLLQLLTDLTVRVAEVERRLREGEASQTETRDTVADLVREHNAVMTRLETAASAPAPAPAPAATVQPAAEVFKTAAAAGAPPATSTAPAREDPAELVGMLLAKRPDLAGKMRACASHDAVALGCPDCRKLTIAALADGNPKLSRIAGLVSGMSGGQGGQLGMLLQLLGG